MDEMPWFESIGCDNDKPLSPPDYRINDCHSWVCKEALRIFIQMREHLCDALVTINPVVLKPVCPLCIYRLTGEAWLDWLNTSSIDIVILWPEPDETNFRLYDAARHSVIFWPAENSHGDNFWPIDCYLCNDRINSRADKEQIIPVVPTPFSEYFNIDEEGPKRARGRKLRAELAEMYGYTCFQCKNPLSLKDVTLDHIVARSQGGQSVPINLQVLCWTCNQKKKDDQVLSIKIGLDFPLRPAPSDSYEGLIW
jgi:HNH endonuclease